VSFAKLDALSNIRDDRKLSKHAKLLCFVLVSHADNAGTCFPGLDTLAEECGIARSSVVEALKELEALGELSPVVVKHRSKQREDGARVGRGRPVNEYVLTTHLRPQDGLKASRPRKRRDARAPDAVADAVTDGMDPFELSPEGGPYSDAFKSEMGGDLSPPHGLEARKGSTTADSDLPTAPELGAKALVLGEHGCAAWEQQRELNRMLIADAGRR
jgi:hypothetical protein